MDEWINKMESMEYYSAIKKSDILPFETTWLTLEGIMLSEISQRETQIYMISLICGIKNNNNNKNQTYRSRKQIGSCQRRGTESRRSR